MRDSTNVHAMIVFSRGYNRTKLHFSYVRGTMLPLPQPRLPNEVRGSTTARAIVYWPTWGFHIESLLRVACGSLVLAGL